MCDSRLYNGKLPAPGSLAMKASGDGFWEFNLADGSAWLSDWFCSRLQWSGPVKRPAFCDLRPLVSPATWDELLRKIRSHLEECTPLDAEFQVRLAQGQSEWWHMRGAAHRNDAGHPTHFGGCVRDITASRGGGGGGSGDKTV
jgi:PAS domain-containing protein